jgi:protein tyrosine/serine phosphatase
MRERIESLADALHREATRETLRWGHDLSLHAWWADADGQVLGGEYPARRESLSDTRAKLSLLVDAGIRTIIDLTERTEGLMPYQEHLEAIAQVRGVAVRRIEHPIRDVDVTTVDHYDRIVADIERSLAANEKVFVHCWGGVGRTATVIGIWLVARGHTADKALDLIKAARTGTRKAGRASPETHHQVDAIRQAHKRRSTMGAANTSPPTVPTAAPG